MDEGAARSGPRATARDAESLIWRLAGVLGIDPGPRTLRELVEMAEAKAEAAWTHTSAILCLVANVNRDPKQKPSPYVPDDFNPLARRTPQLNEEEGIGALKIFLIQ